MKLLSLIICMGLFSSGCNSIAAPTNTVLSTRITSTSEFQPKMIITSTAIHLPSNPVTETAEYCKPPYAFLAVEDGDDISEDEIAYQLAKNWLRRYKTLVAHPYCRIDGYTIDKVYDDPNVYAQPLEPKGDFMRVIVFSVKLNQTPTDWLSFSGELDEKNWLHLRQVMAVFKTNGGYTMQFAYP